MPGAKVELEGDTKMFVELVAQMVVARTNTRGRRLSNNGDKGAVARSVSSSRARAASPGAGASLPGSWEGERAELLVDVPVWSPGCFQGTSFDSYSRVVVVDLAHRTTSVPNEGIFGADCTDLSTLHSLRDRTLAQVHALLAHLISSHSIPASYHLLARSALATPSSPSVSHRSPLNSSAALPITPKYATPAQNAQRARHPGWGCIRLAPSVVSPMMGKLELRPKVRRSSMDFSTSPNKRIPRVQGHARAVTSPSSPTDAKGVLSASVSRAELTPAPALGLETIVARKPLGAGACEPPAGAAVEKEGANESGKVEDLGEKGETVLLETDDAVFVLDNQPEGGDEDEEVLYKSGYTSGTVSDDEDEDADEVVMREIEKRAAKEGYVHNFLFFGLKYGVGFGFCAKEMRLRGGVGFHGAKERRPYAG